MHQNVVLAVFHKQNIHHHMWKTVRTTLQCIDALQLWGKGHEIEKKYGTQLSYSFHRISNLLLGIGEKQNIKV